MVNAIQFDGGVHYAGSSTWSAPRSIWSRSILLNKAVKLPSPKPSSFFALNEFEEHRADLLAEVESD
jgi:hypothetical protein